MRSGKLRHSIELQSFTSTFDSYNQETKTWSTIATVFAEVRPVSARESAIAEQLRAEATHFVSLRGGVELTAANRVLFRGRILNITSVLDVLERGRELNLLCVEITTGE